MTDEMPIPEEQIAKLQAQCAAMRKVLTDLHVIFISRTRSPRMDSDPINLHDLIEVIHKALSPNAGEKVLDVVRAAQDVDFHRPPLLPDKHADLQDALNKLTVTLAVLGWKS